MSASEASADTSLLRRYGNAHGSKALINALTSLRIFQEYQSAFTEATDLPVSMNSSDSE